MHMHIAGIELSQQNSLFLCILLHVGGAEDGRGLGAPLPLQVFFDDRHLCHHSLDGELLLVHLFLQRLVLVAGDEVALFHELRFGARRTCAAAGEDYGSWLE